MPNPEDNNAFELGVSGKIVNEGGVPQTKNFEDGVIPPISLEEAQRRLQVKDHLLNEATKLLARLQDELKGCRARLIEQERELMELREELSKPEG